MDFGQGDEEGWVVEKKPLPFTVCYDIYLCAFYPLRTQDDAIYAC